MRRAPAVLLVALAGCSFSIGGGDKQLNTDTGERLIRAQLTDKTGVPVDRVDCPERKIKEGDVFECTAVLQGQMLRIKVTQTDDEGTIQGEPQQAILDMDKATESLTSSIRSQTGVAVRIGCGDRRYRVYDVGAEFDCQLTNPDGSTRRVVVTVKSIEGDVDYRVV